MQRRRRERKTIDSYKDLGHWRSCIWSQGDCDFSEQLGWAVVGFLVSGLSCWKAGSAGAVGCSQHTSTQLPVGSLRIYGFLTPGTLYRKGENTHGLWVLLMLRRSWWVQTVFLDTLLDKEFTVFCRTSVLVRFWDPFCVNNRNVSNLLCSPALAARLTPH